jgi:ribosomal protein S18 acetylase RimI-like enzyme
MNAISRILPPSVFKSFPQNTVKLFKRTPIKASLSVKSAKTTRSFTVVPRGQHDLRTFTVQPINPHSESDQEKVSQIYKKSLLLNPHGFSWKTNPKEEILNIINSDPVANFFVIKNESGDIAAFSGLKRPSIFHNKQGLPIHTTEEMEIAMLHSDRDKAKGASLGKELLKTLAEHAQKHGKKTLVLHVTATQDHARKLYEKLGFQLDERFSENPKNYKVPLGHIDPIFENTSISDHHQSLQQTGNTRSFPTFHFKVDIKDLVRS